MHRVDVHGPEEDESIFHLGLEGYGKVYMTEVVFSERKVLGESWLELFCRVEYWVVLEYGLNSFSKAIFWRGAIVFLLFVVLWRGK